MRLTYLGDAPTSFLEGRWTSPPQRLTTQPPYAVDALVLFDRPPLPDAAVANYRTLLRYGRPVIRIGRINLPIDRNFMSNLLLISDFDEGDEEVFESWINQRPRTNYQSIDCNFYDHFEQAITRREEVSLAYLELDDRTSNTRVRLLDLCTHQQEEYVQLASREWLRLDRIVSVNGVAAGASCTF